LPQPSGKFWNLDEWLRRLGLARTESPEFIPGIQPVAILGDQTELTTPILVPRAVIGGRFVGGLLTFGAFAWRSLSPGGCFIRALIGCDPAGADQFNISISATPAVLANTVTPLIQNMTTETVVGTPRMGDLAADLGDLFPIWRDPSGLRVDGKDSFIYLRSGTELVIAQRRVNRTSFFLIIVQDVPVMVPEV